ncbi:hypothetical protein DIPPA_62097 [Diplonema papillatum]|nr:hypothetical protein DIPPA_62097 [Diplonema papillatum]
MRAQPVCAGDTILSIRTSVLGSGIAVSHARKKTPWVSSENDSFNEGDEATFVQAVTFASGRVVKAGTRCTILRMSFEVSDDEVYIAGTPIIRTGEVYSVDKKTCNVTLRYPDSTKVSVHESKLRSKYQNTRIEGDADELQTLIWGSNLTKHDTDTVFDAYDSATGILYENVPVSSATFTKSRGSYSLRRLVYSNSHTLFEAVQLACNLFGKFPCVSIINADVPCEEGTQHHTLLQNGFSILTSPFDNPEFIGVSDATAERTSRWLSLSVVYLYIEAAKSRVLDCLCKAARGIVDDIQKAQVKAVNTISIPRIVTSGSISLEHYIIYVTCLIMEEAVLVPVHPEAPEDVVRHIANECNPSLVFVDAAAVSLWHQVRRQAVAAGEDEHGLQEEKYFQLITLDRKVEGFPCIHDWFRESEKFASKDSPPCVWESDKTKAPGCSSEKNPEHTAMLRSAHSSAVVQVMRSNVLASSGRGIIDVPFADDVVLNELNTNAKSVSSVSVHARVAGIRSIDEKVVGWVAVRAEDFSLEAQPLHTQGISSSSTTVVCEAVFSVASEGAASTLEIQSLNKLGEQTTGLPAAGGCTDISIKAVSIEDPTAVGVFAASLTVRFGESRNRVVLKTETTLARPSDIWSIAEESAEHGTCQMCQKGLFLLTNTTIPLECAQCTEHIDPKTVHLCFTCGLATCSLCASSGKPREKGYTAASDSTAAVILYTSGSTGQPKGVIMPHGTLFKEWLSSGFPGDKEKCALLCGPLSTSTDPLHILSNMCAGGRLVLADSKSEGAEFMKTVGPTSVSIVPQVCSLLYKSSLRLQQHVQNRDACTQGEAEQVADRLFRSELGCRIISINCGGAKSDPVVMDWLRRVFAHARVTENYATTEVGAIGFDAENTGILLEDSCEYKLASWGAYTPTGDPPCGELCVKTKFMFSGYFNRPDLTEEAFDADGFYRTGDIVEISKFRPNANSETKTVIKVIDRKTCFVKLSNGEWVSPEEIERVLNRSPFIKQSFVFGSGQDLAVVAIVVCDPGVQFNGRFTQGSTHKNNSEGAAQDIVRDDGEENEEHGTNRACENVIVGVKKEHVNEYVCSTGDKFAGDSNARATACPPEAAYLKMCRLLCREAGLRSHQAPAAVHVSCEAFTTGNGLLTATGKLCRPNLRKRYAEILNNLREQADMAHSKECTVSAKQVVEFVRTLRTSLADGAPQLESSLRAGWDDLDLFNDSIQAMHTAMTIKRSFNLKISPGVFIGKPSFDTLKLAIILAANELSQMPTYNGVKAQLHKDVNEALVGLGSSFSSDGLKTEKWILITGASGFLGAAVLEELLMVAEGESKTFAGGLPCRVAVIIRDLGRFKKRMDSRDMQSLIKRCTKKEHLKIMIGDLSAADCGLTAENRAFIRQNVSHVLSCAAVVNFAAQYEAVKDVNVFGVGRLLKLVSPNTTEIAHVSTSSVSESANCLLCTNDFGAYLLESDGYTLSKAVSEVVCNRARLELGYRIKIVRPGMIGPDTQCGAANTTDWLVRYIVGTLALGVFPSSQGDAKVSVSLSCPMYCAQVALATLFPDAIRQGAANFALPPDVSLPICIPQDVISASAFHKRLQAASNKLNRSLMPCSINHWQNQLDSLPASHALYPVMDYFYDGFPPVGQSCLTPGTNVPSPPSYDQTAFSKTVHWLVTHHFLLTT